MLHGRCDGPDVTFFAFDVQASAGVDGDVREVSVEIVICCPQPVIFHVETGCCFGNVHRHKGADARGVDLGAVAGRRTCAVAVWAGLTAVRRV